jgi:hypothetical protein
MQFQAAASLQAAQHPARKNKEEKAAAALVTTEFLLETCI